jgi:hypothetical protein
MTTMTVTRQTTTNTTIKQKEKSETTEALLWYSYIDRIMRLYVLVSMHSWIMNDFVDSHALNFTVLAVLDDMNEVQQVVGGKRIVLIQRLVNEL